LFPIEDAASLHFPGAGGDFNELQILWYRVFTVFNILAAALLWYVVIALIVTLMWHGFQLI